MEDLHVEVERHLVTDATVAPVPSIKSTVATLDDGPAEDPAAVNAALGR
jgi:hypothetical protein